jgi:hypothetical protein
MLCKKKGRFVLAEAIKWSTFVTRKREGGTFIEAIERIKELEIS